MNAPADPKQLERQRFIGGSDAAPILGVAPTTWERSTPLDVFLEKTGQAERIPFDEKKAAILKRGKRLEPIVVNMLIEDRGVKVTKRSSEAQPNRYFDPEHPFLGAEIDYEWEVTADIADELNLDPALVGTTQNGEAKTVHVFAGAKFGDGDEDVPIEYAAQALHGLMVTGRQICLFGVLFGADKLELYLVKRDEQTINVMRARMVSFWNDYVLAGVEPEPIHLHDVEVLLKRRESIRVEASADAIGWLAALEKAKSDRAAAEEEIEEHKFLIGKFMLGEHAIARPVGPMGGKKGVEPTALASPISHELTVDNAPALVINLQQQSRVDTKRLRKERPEIASEFSYAMKFFKFEKPRATKARRSK